ncbi:MAG TPA: NFACT RNA binding domain-containing protein [Anaerovoracaceae bacterium]|nr:NFACT RNA binding domain-containing protein [Anaerovoracaceae bacterium]
MAYDGLITGAMAIHLNRLLAGGKIDKIYQPDRDELVFHIRTGSDRRKLYISSNSSHARMHLLEMEKEQPNPQNPTAFCMLLRKHLQGGRIKQIKQVLSERIVEIDVDQIDELGFIVQKRLTVEIMGKHSNIVAIDIATGKIIDSIKRISADLNRYRQILPGIPYVYPPDHGKTCFYTISEEDIAKVMSKMDISLPKALLNGIMGVSPAISRTICELAVASKKKDADSLDIRDIKNVIDEMTEHIFAGDYEPIVYTDKDNIPIDFHIFPMADNEALLDKTTFDDLSDAVEYYYYHKLSSNRIRQKSNDLIRTVSNLLDKQYLKKQKISEEIHAAQNSEHYRLYGELLLANIYNIPQSASKATVVNYYDNEELTISLDPRFTVSENAQQYFKKYSKAKTALIKKGTQIKETDNTVDYLESVLVFIENADTVLEVEEIRNELTEAGYLRKRKNSYKIAKPKLRPLKFTSCDGTLILVGRNNRENDHLTFKTANRRDIWFHTKDIPGSHVILSVGADSPSENAMKEAASLAAYYSKARNSGNVPVDYTAVRHVKKRPAAKSGMVIYTNYKTIFADPLKDLDNK